MAKFRRGQEAIEQAAQRSTGGSFTPQIRFEAGEDKYVQFLMPIEEVPTVLMHRFIIVGEYENGNPRYESFISRRDPYLDGASGYDELMDRFDVQPTNRSIVLAAEMKPILGAGTGKRKKLEGFELDMRQFEDSEGNVKTVPAFGLIIESPSIFFTHLAANADINPIEETVWLVKRTGKGTDTTYTFIPTGIEALDLEEELEEFSETFDLDEYLSNLADEDRMRELISPLPDDAKVTMYPAKKSKSGGKVYGSKRTQSRRQEEEVDETDAETDESEDSAASTRSRRFESLREKTKAKV